MQRYVLGFCFSPSGRSVVLIRKERPAWQRGLWNGVGGKVEEGESPEVAMSREFEEETGLRVHQRDWDHRAVLSGDGLRVDVYATRTTDYVRCRTREEEFVRAHPVADLPESCVSNVPWLVHLCLDCGTRGGVPPAVVTAEYR